MRFIKWFLFNGTFAFIVYDGTIGITPLSKNSANLIPFLVVIFFALAIVVGLIYLIILAFHDEMDRDKLIVFRDKLNKRSKSWRVFNLVFDIVVCFWLASFGFIWSAIFYFIHIPIVQIIGQMKYMLIDELGNI